MHVGPILSAARSVPRALKATGLILGLLFGLSGGLAIAAAVMAADVQSSYDRLTDTTDGFDAAIFASAPVEGPAADLRGVEGIVEARDLTFFDVAAFTTDELDVALGPQPEDPCYTGAGDVGATVHTEGWRGRSPQMALAAGRFPLVNAREVVLPTITANRLGLGVGDRVVFGGSCGREEATFEPPIEVRISGLGTSVFDGPELGANFALETLLISPRLVDELIEAGAEESTAALAWLDDGVRPSELVGLPEGSEVALDMVEAREAVRRDLRPDTNALRAFAGIVAVSALVILGPTFGRLVRAGQATTPTLRSLGMDRRALVAIGLARGAAVGLVVAPVTAAATIAFATQLPVGAARHFDGAIPFSPGAFQVLAGALLVGAAAVAIVVAVSVIAVRRRPPTGAQRPETRVRRIHALRALRPEWSMGVRFALEPGSLADPTPARSGLTTAAVAVATVVGVITFSSSLDHLRTTPRLYGFNWDAFAFLEDPELAAALEGDPDVEALSRATFFPPQSATLGEDGQEVWLMSFEAGPGRIEPSIISGRAPEADHEVMLSHELSSTTGAGIGETVRLHLPATEAFLASGLAQPWDGPEERATELEVVGIGVLPIGDGRVGIGASMTLGGLKEAIGPSDSPALRRIVADASPADRTKALRENVDPELTAADVAAMSDVEVLHRLVDTFDAQIVVFDAGGPDRAAERAIAASGGTLSPEDVLNRPTPERAINLDLSQPGRIPDAFSGLMAVVAVGVIAVLVASGGGHRRRDLAILRALGVGTREVRRTLAAQAIATVLAALMLVPVGVAVGRLAWLSYATSVGVVPEARVAPLYIVAAIGALLVTAFAVAMIVAHIHLRRSLAMLLRPRE